MSTTAVNDELPSLLDWAKRTDPNGAIANIAEVLQRKNPMLQDAVVMEGNLPTGHRFTSQTGLPSVAWRRLNEGVDPSKSRTAQIDETVGMLSGYSVVDVDLAKLGGNAAAFRASEDKAFMSAMNNEVQTGIVYHSTKTAPEKFMGLAPRLDALSGIAAATQVIDGLSGVSSSGSDQTSIYLVGWGPNGAFLIFPKGSQAGLEHKDMGEQLWDDANGKKFTAFVTEWKWKVGLVVKDWRQVVRIGNIDTSALVGTGDLLIQDMISAYHQVEDPNEGRFAWYMNRKVATFLHKQSIDSTKSSTLVIDSQGPGVKPIASFMGIPIRITDAITNTEAVLT